MIFSRFSVFSSFKSSPSILWPSLGPYSCSVPICNLLNYFYIFQSLKMFPTFYFLCFHTFNIFSFYRLLRFYIISYSPSFLRHNWSTYLPWCLSPRILPLKIILPLIASNHLLLTIHTIGKWSLIRRLITWSCLIQILADNLSETFESRRLRPITELLPYLNGRCCHCVVIDAYFGTVILNLQREMIEKTSSAQCLSQ